MTILRSMLMYQAEKALHPFFLIDRLYEDRKGETFNGWLKTVIYQTLFEYVNN